MTLRVGITRPNAMTVPRVDPFVSPSRRAGVCLHVTSLPGAYGIGEIGAAAHAFVDLLADTGFGVWQFLPIGPTAYGDSPYQSLSTFAGNELLIDLGGLVGDELLAVAIGTTVLFELVGPILATVALRRVGEASTRPVLPRSGPG